MIRRVTIISLLFVFLITSSSFAKVELYHEENGKYNLDETFVNTGSGPNYILNGKLMVIGDSYAFLFCDNVNESLNYVVHPGYNVKKIKNELMNRIKNGDYSYVYLCIGPNDFMEQTDLNSFRETVNEIVSILESKSTKIIFSTYWEPDYSRGVGSQTVRFDKKCYQYDLVIKETAEQRNLIFVDTSDLLQLYGWDALDGVHPNKEVYNPFLYRIMDAIALDLDKTNEVVKK